MSWQAKLQTLVADRTRRVAWSRDVYARLGKLLNRYRGGAPAGFLAAVAQFESGGQMSARGDANLGEVGIFQITSSFPPKVGVPASARYDLETNVFLGCLEYQIEASELWQRWPAFIWLGSADNWKLARLAFAIGGPGTNTLIAKTHEAGMLRMGDVYGSVKAWVNRTGGMSLGAQDAGKVWFRVHSIDVLWWIGARVAPLYFSAPQKIPSPHGVSYTIPGNVRGLSSPFAPLAAFAISTGMILLGG